MLLPEGKIAPPPLLTNIIATDRWQIVQGAAGNIARRLEKLRPKHPGCSIRLGAMLRAYLIDQMDRAGFTPMIAAEIHNMHLQLEFVQSGYGLGLLPARFIASTISSDNG